MPNELKNQNAYQGGITKGVHPAVPVVRNPGTRNWTAVSNGIGDVTITYDPDFPQLATASSIVGLTPRGASARIIQVSAQTASTLRVLAFDAAGVAAEADFDFEITQTP